MDNHSYWKKLTSAKEYSDLEWNIPEQKTGVINLIGGNSASFSTVVHSAEFLINKFPIKTLNIFLPDVLKSKLPPAPNLFFLPSTTSGSFAKSPLLEQYLSESNTNIYIGDFSKNSATTVAISNALKVNSIPSVLTRDTIDLILPEIPNLIERENLFLVGSMAQIQKVFRAAYYPKVLLLSMPLVSIVEALHKFTLSYPTTILSFHQDQIIVAYHGQIITVPIEKTTYSPISLWSGQLACKIAMNNLYSPNKNLESTVFSIF